VPYSCRSLSTNASMYGWNRHCWSLSCGYAGRVAPHPVHRFESRPLSPIRAKLRRLAQSSESASSCFPNIRGSPDSLARPAREASQEHVAPHPGRRGERVSPAQWQSSAAAGRIVAMDSACGAGSSRSRSSA
jgi:hypothetical protein